MPTGSLGGTGGLGASDSDPTQLWATNRRISLLAENVPELDPGSIYSIATQPTEDDEMLASALGAVTSADWGQITATTKQLPDDVQRSLWAGRSEEERRILSQYGYQPPDGAVTSSITPEGAQRLRSLRATASSGIDLPSVGEIIGGGAEKVGEGLSFVGDQAMNVLGYMHTAGDTFAGRPSRTATDVSATERFARFQLTLNQARQNLSVNGLQLTDDQWKGMMSRLYTDNDINFDAWEHFSINNYEAGNPFAGEHEPVDDGTYNQFLDEVNNLKSEDEYDLSWQTAWHRTATGEQYVKASSQIEAQRLLGGDGDAFDAAYAWARGKSTEQIVTEEGLTADDPRFAQRYMELEQLKTNETVLQAAEVMAKGKVSLGREFTRDVLGLDPSSGLGQWTSGATDLVSILALDPLLFGGKVGKGIRAYKFAIKETADIEEVRRLALAYQSMKKGETVIGRSLGGVFGEGAARLDNQSIAVGQYLTKAGEKDPGFYRFIRGSFDQEGLEMGALVDGAGNPTKLLLDNREGILRALDDADMRIGSISARGRGAAKQMTAMQDKVGDLRGLVNSLELTTLDSLSPLLKYKMKLADRQWSAAERMAKAFRDTRSGADEYAFSHLVDDMPSAIRGIDPLITYDRALFEATGRHIESADDIFDFYRSIDGLTALTSRKFGQFATPNLMELPRVGNRGTVQIRRFGQKVDDSIDWAAESTVHINVLGKNRKIPLLEPFGRMAKAITTQTPKERTLLFVDDGMRSSIAEARNFFEIGAFSNMPKQIRRDYFEQFIRGTIHEGDDVFRTNIANRIEVQMRFTEDLFERAGVKMTPAGKEWAEDFTLRLKQQYAAGGRDLVRMGDRMVPQPLLPYAQWSTQVVVPDFKGFLAQTRRTAAMHRMWGGVNHGMVDAFMGQYWKPAMLLKMGFIPRAAGEEMLGFFAKVGTDDFLDAMLGKFAAIEGDSKLMRATDAVTSLKPIRWSRDPNALTSRLGEARTSIRHLPDDAYHYEQFVAHKSYRDWRQGMIDQYLDEIPFDDITRMDRVSGWADYHAARAIKAFHTAMFRATSVEMKAAVVARTINAGRDPLHYTEMLAHQLDQKGIQLASQRLFRHAAMQRYTADVAAGGTWATYAADQGRTPFSTVKMKNSSWARGETKDIQLRIMLSNWVEQDLGSGDETLALLGYALRPYGNDPVSLAMLDAMAGVIPQDKLDELGLLLTGRYGPDGELFAQIDRRASLLDEWETWNQQFDYSTSVGAIDDVNAEAAAMAAWKEENAWIFEPAPAVTSDAMGQVRRLEADLDTLRGTDWFDAMRAHLQGSGDQIHKLAPHDTGHLVVDAAGNPQLSRMFEGSRKRSITHYLLDGAAKDPIKKELLLTLTKVDRNLALSMMADVPVTVADDIADQARRVEAAVRALTHPEMQPFVREQWRANFLSSTGNPVAKPLSRDETRWFGIMADPETATVIAGGNRTNDGIEQMLGELVGTGKLLDGDIPIVKRMLTEQGEGPTRARIIGQSHSDLDLVPVSHFVTTDAAAAERISEAFRAWNMPSHPGVKIISPGTFDVADSAHLPLGMGEAAMWRMDDMPETWRATANWRAQKLEPYDDQATAFLADDALDPTGQYKEWAMDLDAAMTDTFRNQGGWNHQLTEPLRTGTFDFAAVNSVAHADLPQQFIAPLRYVSNDAMFTRGVRYGFDHIIGPAIASLVRKPMWLYEYKNALKALEPLENVLRNRALYDEAAERLGMYGDELHASREVWDVIPEEVRRVMGVDRDTIVATVGRDPLARHDQISKTREWMAGHTGAHPSLEQFLDLADDDFAFWWRFMTHDTAVERKVSDVALERTHQSMVQVIDDHRVRSYFQGYASNLIPFWFAQEQFLKRWARILVHSPEAARRAQLLGHGVLSSGFTHEDDYGNPVFVIPGSEHLQSILANTPIINTLWGGAAKVPISQPLTGAMKWALPGIGAGAFDLPGASPVVSLPLNGLIDHFPELRPLGETVLGEMGVDRDWMDTLMPTWAARTYKAVMGGDAASKEINASAIAALQMMEAEAIRLNAEGDKLSAEGKIEEAQKKYDRAAELVPPEGDAANEVTVDQFIDEVKQWSRSVLMTRAIGSFWSPAPVAAEYGGIGLSQEFAELLEHMEFDDALAVFLAEHPEAGPYAVFQSESESGAPLPATTESLEWMQQHRTYLEEHPLAGPWMMPQDGTGVSFSREAYADMIAMGLRSKKAPEDWYRDWKFAAAAEPYFQSRDTYQRALAATHPDDSARRAELTRQYNSWADDYKKKHKVFATMLEQTTRIRKEDALNELRLVLDDPQAPAVPHGAVMGELIDGYDTYKRALAQYRGDQSKVGREARQALKLQFANWGMRKIAENPMAATFWYSIIEPLADFGDDAQVKAVVEADPQDLALSAFGR